MCFTVATIPDDLAEGDETFLVKLTDATVPQGEDPVGIGDFDGYCDDPGQ